jgi:hypothetical protein
MDMEDGIPRRQPLFRTQSVQQIKKLNTKGNQSVSSYVASRSCDDLNMNKDKPLVDLATPVCNSTIKIIDQMENLKFEQFDPVLTTTHIDRINEQVDLFDSKSFG